MFTSGTFDKNEYASFIQEFTDLTQITLSAQLIKLASTSSAFVSQKSKTQEKSGSIIEIVGKSVSFVTISSICPSTHFIKNQGNQ